MILACAPCRPGTLRCYTFGGMYRDCADVTISRRAAEICGQPHETIALTRDFFSDFPALVEKSVYLTDGTLDPTGAANLLSTGLPDKNRRCGSSGLNGGEILRSLVMFKPGGPSRWAPSRAAIEGAHRGCCCNLCP